jgi:uncharacterized protein (TIGR03382 family)
VRVALTVLLVSLFSSSALAQTVDPATDPTALQAEVDAAYAQAMASDCTLACLALGSMRRATERLCAIDPGERCTSARQKLDAATAHVRAACPDCAEKLGRENELAQPAPPPASPAEATTEQESVSKRGGCAGCSATTRGADATGAVCLAALAWLGLRRRRRS